SGSDGDVVVPPIPREGSNTARGSSIVRDMRKVRLRLMLTKVRNDLNQKLIFPASWQTSLMHFHHTCLTLQPRPSSVLRGCEGRMGPLLSLPPGFSMSPAIIWVCSPLSEFPCPPAQGLTPVRILSLSGDGMVSEIKEENPQQESPERVEPQGTVSGRGERVVFQSPEEGETCESQSRPKRQQGNHSEERWGKSTHSRRGVNKVKETIQQRIPSRERPYICGDCGKSFQYRSDLIIYQRIHTHQRPDRGPDCGKRSPHRSTLSGHRTLHTGEKPYKCPDCGKSFAQGSALIQHQRLHMEEKPYNCPICGKSFCETSSLIRHQKIHTGEKLYNCPDCGKGFGERSAHIKRQRIQPGKKPYKCNECGKSFSQKSYLLSHHRIHRRETL
uniref:C2H2-type domain-containing protein n=1 Tax=Terrapene triunguis TaxID=2587831 RepID=A0A674J4D2_9SAUR